MKFVLTFLSFLWLTSGFAQLGTRTINNVIGDESFTKVFGYAPDNSTDEKIRIQTHLSYVEFLLRGRENDNLSKEQQAKRTHILDLLKTYSEAGNFPANNDYLDERRPCFIDRDGNICAVGFLVAETAGMEVAEEINKTHQYDFLFDMNEKVLAEWATENGLTLEECALIQPTYGPPPQYDYASPGLKTGYGISSALVSGTNIAVSVLNLTGGNNCKEFSYVGIATGTAGIVMGILNIRKDTYVQEINGYPERVSYKAQNNLSYVNIAIGTTSLVSSTINLLMNKNRKEKKNNLSLYSYPGINNQLNVGFSLTKRI